MCRICIYVDIETDQEEYPGQFDIIRAAHEFLKFKEAARRRKEARLDAYMHGIHCNGMCPECMKKH